MDSISLALYIYSKVIFLFQPNNMKHKGCTVSLVLFFMLFGMYCVVDSRKTSDIYTISQEDGDIGQIEDACAEIIGPAWNKDKEGKTPCPCPVLQVVVPKKEGFSELIKVDDQLKVKDGFSIAVFCYALQALPFRVQPIFTAIDIKKDNLTYDQLIYQIRDKNCTAVAADLTIRSNRAQNVSFTIPYLSSEVYMLVHATHEWNQTLWTFLKPFTPRLWIAILCTCFSTGLALAILEYRAHNPQFKSPFYSNIIMVFWYPISAFFFQEGMIRNRCSKVVLVVWLSTIFIVLQIFTATLSSWLTLNQLHPRMPLINKVGYQDCSFLKEFITEKYKDRNKTTLIPLKDVEEYRNALSNGSVDVVFDELPYIQLFLNKYGSDYMKIGPINQESGIAFAFSHRSPLLPIFSRAVIDVTESDNMMNMMVKYLGFSTQDKSQPDPDLPQSLDVQSFYGLFIIMGIVTITAIISSEISLMRSNTKVGDLKEEPKEQATIFIKNFVIFMGIVAIAAFISSKNYLLQRNNKTSDEKEGPKEQSTISE